MAAASTSFWILEIIWGFLLELIFWSQENHSSSCLLDEPGFDKALLS